MILVGMGRMGRHHLEALSRGRTWNLAGIVDPNLPLDVSASSVKQGRDLRVLLAESRPFAAIVAVPPESHDAVSRICLESGCHVLLEKPICPSHEQAIRLQRDFRRSGVVLFGGHSERFHPVFECLRLQLSRIGEVQRIEAIRQGAIPQRTERGGVVFDLAVHDLDLIVRLVGKPLQVTGAVVEGGTNTSPVSCRADLAWESGAAVVEASWKPQRRRTLRVIGTHGVLDADFLAPSLTLTDAKGVWRQKLTWTDPLESEHATFLAACQGGFDALADLAPQIEAVRLAERILRD